jgi:hypothetical protein
MTTHAAHARPVAALLSLLCITACSGVNGIDDPLLCGDAGPGGNSTSTSALSAATVAGVCAKYNELACDDPNCAAQLTLAQQNCATTPNTFQQLLNCLSVATLTCGGSPATPQADQCTSELVDVSTCDATGSTPIGTTQGSGFSASNDAGSVTSTSGCQSSDACTAWACSCNDGFSTSLAVCSSGTCQGPVYVCSTANPSAVSACASHGGVL